MAAELGQMGLILALIAALYQGMFPLWAGMRGDRVMAAAARPAAFASLLFTAAAFLALTFVHATSDFSVRNVVENSHSTKPFLYKISGVWGSHEGSILLWTLILTGFGAAIALNLAKRAGAKSGGDEAIASTALAVQGLISAAFLAFVLLTSNPFERVFPPALDGRDLNPLLQDPGLAIHPPFLYLGYVGFSAPFAFAIAGLVHGRVDAAWARAMRPFALTAWAFLTIGIALGSWWAYYELGWGGFWAWDPVENASFMPWLAGTALLHSLRALETRTIFPGWVVFLAILAFSLSLIGTFLVRSGILTSVHAFAVDPARGIYILLILAIVIGGSLALFAARAPGLSSPARLGPVSRESAILFNNLFLLGGCAVVFIGTFYPLFAEIASGARISVGAPFFNLAFLPFMGLILLVIGPGSALAWKKGDLAASLARLKIAGLVSLGVTIIALALYWQKAGAVIGVGLAGFAGLSTLAEILRRIRPWRDGALARTAHTPSAFWSMSLAHLGLAVAAFGVLGAGAFPREVIRYVAPGSRLAIGAYEVQLKDVRAGKGPNYESAIAVFSVSSGGRFLRDLRAERRFYPVRGMQTTEAAIWSRLSGDLYLTLGERHREQGYVVRAHVYPLAGLMWAGATLMGFGGFVGLFGLRGRSARARRETVSKAATALAEPPVHGPKVAGLRSAPTPAERR